MEGKIISQILNEVFSPFTKGIQSFFLILSHPEEYAANLKKSPNDHLISAFIFVIFVSLVNLGLSIPTLVKLKISAMTNQYIITDTILTIISLFICGSFFHFSAKLFWGNGSFTGSIITFFYSTGFILILNFTLFPYKQAYMQHLISKKDFFTVESLSSFPIRFNINDSSSYPLIIYYIVFIWYIHTLARVFRRIHEVGTIRGIFIALFGMSFYMILEVILQMPIYKSFWQEF